MSLLSMKYRNSKPIKFLTERLLQRSSVLVFIGTVFGLALSGINNTRFEASTNFWSRDISIEAGISKISFGRRLDWDQAPQFCKFILQDPKPFSKTCDHNPADWTCRFRKGTSAMFSTGHQDYYLFTKHFKYLRRKGIYIDIATNDPVRTSNTFFFDRCLGWPGICVEANHRYFESIYRLRSCSLVPTCISRKDGQIVQFNLNRLRGGIVDDSYKFIDEVQKNRNTSEIVRQRCTTMRNIVRRNGITTIDLLSLDVEGHEMDVLRSFDLEKVVIKVLTVEVSKSNSEKLSSFLSNYGYVKHLIDKSFIGNASGFFLEDDIYLHETVNQIESTVVPQNRKKINIHEGLFQGIYRSPMCHVMNYNFGDNRWPRKKPR